MLDPETIKYLKQKFSDYYKEANLQHPARFGRREFGFMFFDRDGMIRHLSFNTRDEIKNFLIENAPAHVYHSSAYYEKPDIPEMDDKIWLGADLIFDLDADHVERAKNLAYAEMLAVVKEETMKLIENFLISDFGFDEKYIKVNFSGGRGYHIHVTDPKAQSLNAYERREILDYITGTGIDYEKVFGKEAYDVLQTGLRRITKRTMRMPKGDAKGWEGKIGRAIIDFITSMETMPREKIISRFQSYGIRKKTAEGIYGDLFEGAVGKRGAEKIKTGKIDIFSKESNLNEFLKIIQNQIKISIGGETDEPVTSDTKRLIRLQTSLHGKTGLKVVGMKIDELKKFEPLRDAVAFSNEPTKIKILKLSSFSLKNEKFDLNEGETELPEFAAVFALCRGLGVKI